MEKLWFVFGILLSLPSFFSCIPVSCDFETLIGDDANFCNGGLHVIYPNMGEVSCIYIPNCFEYPDSVTKVWGPPWIKFSKAKLEKMYTLIMVYTEAPRFLRHWLVTDIPGHILRRGRDVTGNVLSPYRRPNPPAWTGYHRYQFLLYTQYPGVSPTLIPGEEDLKAWDVNAFVLRWILENPVATTQFMIRHPDHSHLEIVKNI